MAEDWNLSGIVGIFQTDGEPASGELLAHMIDAIAHRGPDAQCRWLEGPVAFGHCMLRATPESLEEVQPLRDDATRTVLCFDGRVDNREDLIALLTAKEPTTKVATDAELVLKAYLRWGEDCPAKILGDFAFVIWDATKNRMVCARDPIGIKPLYYHFDGKKFLVSSEMQPLLKDIAPALQPNVPLIARYMEEDFSDRTSTLYPEIQAVPPAHCIVMHGSGVIRSSRYWSIRPSAPAKRKTTQEYVAEFNRLFREAVRCRLRVNGVIGATLSGGLDSSSIVCVAQRLLRESPESDNGFKVFSATSKTLPSTPDGETFDETEYIDSVLSRLELEPGYHYYDDDAPLQSIVESARIYRDVLYNPTLSIVTPILERASQKGVKVLLNGIGGDDIFGADPGLYLYRYAELIMRFRLAELLKDLRLALKYYSLAEVTGLFFKYGIASVAGSLARKLRRLSIRLSRSEPAFEEPHLPSIFHQKIHENLMESWNTTLGLEDLDRCCSRHAIEPRYPFLDVRLIEYVLGIPAEQLSRRYQTKLILRRSMKGILPEDVRRRNTRGSAFPVVESEMKYVRKEEIQQLLDSPSLTEGIDWSEIRCIYSKYLDDKQTQVENVRKVVRAIGLELWHRVQTQH